MSDPKLRVRSSGHGGSGYKHPESGVVVPGVTTVLKMSNKPALIQWAVDQTAAYAVANVDGLLSRTEEQGWGFLRWYWNRDPLKGEVDIRNFYNGVRDDAANLGTLIHEWIEADTTDGIYPDTTDAPEFLWQMVEQWDKWFAEHDVKPIVSEGTVWSHKHGYAGTMDGIWEIDGVTYLLDVKSSRNIFDEHFMQLAALGEADVLMVEVEEGVWEEKPMPKFDAYAILHIRPQDVDKDGNVKDAYCTLDILDKDEMPYHFDAFKGLLQVSHSKIALKEKRKEIQNSSEF